MKSLRTQTLLIISILLTVTGVVAYGLLFKAMKTSNDNVLHLIESVKHNDNARAEALSLKKLVDAVGPDIKKIDSYYLASDGAVNFIEMVEQLGRDAGVNAEFSSVSLAQQTKSKSTEKLRLSIFFKGTWKNAVHFLSLLESLPYDLSFTHLLFTGGEHSDDPGKDIWQGKADIEVLKLNDSSQ